MKQLARLSTLTLAISLSGCAMFAPSYQKPQLTAPTSTRSGLQIESSAQDYSQLQWWKKLNDPVLNQLITQALANNNQIQEAQGNIMQAQAQLKSAQYAWLPTLNATGGGFVGNSWQTNYTPNGGNTTSLGNTNFSGYYGGFMPSYSLNIFHNINQTKYAKASLEMQQAAISATRLSIIGQVSGAYFMLLGQRKQLQLQQEMVNDLIALRKLQAIQVQNGASDGSNLAIIDQELASYQAKIPATENSIASSENTIQLLLNNNPGAIKTTNDINSLDISGLIPANLPSAVLKNRPDILEAEDNLKMANANVGLATSTFFPNISLTGLIGGVSMGLSNLLSLSSGFWEAQAAASMPILNSADYEQIKSAKGGYYVAYYDYMQTVKSAFQNVDDKLTNQQKKNQVYTITQQSLSSAQKFYQISLAKYNAGAKDQRDVIGAKLDVDNTTLSLNQAKMDQLDALVQVYQALAGGYNAESELSQPRKIL